VGSKLHAYAVYDNTINNPFQPSNPPKLVTQGEATTDEMMLVYFAFLAYQPGDENIVLDSTLLSSGLMEIERSKPLTIFPNPVKEQLQISFETTETANYRARIADAQGRIVKFFAEKLDVAPGSHQEKFEVSDLAPGMYFMEVQSNKGEVFSGRFVVDF
jgi:hypothetical protein